MGQQRSQGDARPRLGALSSGARPNSVATGADLDAQSPVLGARWPSLPALLSALPLAVLVASGFRQHCDTTDQHKHTVKELGKY